MVSENKEKASLFLKMVNFKHLNGVLKYFEHFLAAFLGKGVSKNLG